MERERDHFFFCNNVKDWPKTALKSVQHETMSMGRLLILPIRCV